MNQNNRTDVMTPEQRRKAMKAMRGKDTKIERILGKALWARGWRYRKNDKRFPGKPDFTFGKYKIAIFVDGEFFHGYNWEENKYRIKANREFWWSKIERNMERDNEVNRKLEDMDWKVMRFWGKEIKKNLDSCLKEIESAIQIQKKLL